jgi:hypothetical protein
MFLWYAVAWIEAVVIVFLVLVVVHLRAVAGQLISAYHLALCELDEAKRALAAVGRMTEIRSQTVVRLAEARRSSDG